MGTSRLKEAALGILMFCPLDRSYGMDQRHLTKPYQLAVFFYEDQQGFGEDSEFSILVLQQLFTQKYKIGFHIFCLNPVNLRTLYGGIISSYSYFTTS